MTDISATDYRAQLNRIMPDPPTKSDGNLDLYQFMTLIYWIMNIEKPDVVFIPSFPKYLQEGSPEFKSIFSVDNPTEMFPDTITYKVTRQEPATIGGDSQMFGSGPQELTPRLRETGNATNSSGGSVSRDVYAMRFDTLVQFDLFSLTNTEVEELTNWFQNFMTTHRDYFKYRGVSECLFRLRVTDDTLSELNKEVQSRSLVYGIRTESIISKDITILNELDARLEQIVR